MSSKIITVWGSPASGKTLLSLSLGAAFAAQKNNTVILNGDKLIPALPVYMPKEKFSSADSIGPLLMTNRYTDAELAFMGLSSFENYITYTEFSKESVIRMINKLSNMTDYLIIDGVSNPLENMVTLTGLETADVIIRMITPDAKGIGYSKAAENIYVDDRFRYSEHIKILGNVRNISPEVEIMSVMGSFDHVLEYSYEAESKMIAGELLRGFERSSGIKYEKRIEKICKDINGWNTAVGIAAAFGQQYHR